MSRSGAHTWVHSFAGVLLGACTVAVVAICGATSRTAAEERFLKLTPSQIKARLAGMEITDGVHWAEQYMRDGTLNAFHMGTASKGKWYIRNGELCLDAGKTELECKEVWLSGNKVEFRVLGSALPALDGVLQKQEPRS